VRYSAAFADQLDALGIWWPRGDGDAMREAARAWTSIADVLDEATEALDAAVLAAAEDYRGQAATELTELWAEWSGADGHLLATAGDCRRLAVSLTDFGGDIDLAHSTLVRLIEDVLGGSGVVTSDDELEQIRDGADRIGHDLTRRADARGSGLGSVRTQQPRTPADRTAIDPERVAWTDPGDPGDLTFLVTGSVDLGAGEGTVATLLPGLIDNADLTGDTADPDGVERGYSPFGPTVCCHPPTDTGAATDSGRGLDSGGAEFGSLAGRGADDSAAAVAGAAAIRLPIPDAPAAGQHDQAKIDLGGGYGGGGGLGHGAGGGVDLPDPFDGLDDLLHDPLVDPAVDPSAPTAVDFGHVAGVVAPVAAATAIPAAAVLGSGSSAGASTAAAAVGRSSGGRMPFIPMMPMMGSGGEDGAEPTRRKPAKHRWPAPTPTVSGAP